ncbi:MAG: hypothetical protein JST48_08185 [Bacteroidetes bacterium]|nr:hypothetical protein [Bacteroidota bacterium]
MFEWKGRVTKEQKLLYWNVLKNYVNSKLSWIRGIDPSDQDEKLKRTCKFLTKFHKELELEIQLAGEEDVNKSIYSFDLDFLPAYPPFNGTPPNKFFCPKLSFYDHLIRNTVAITLSAGYQEFYERDDKGKDKLKSFFYDSLFRDTIQMAYFESVNEEKYYKLTFPWSKDSGYWIDQTYNNYIIRLVGCSLIWMYGELKEFFEVQYKYEAKSLEELYYRYPFDTQPEGKWESNLVNVSERVAKQMTLCVPYKSKSITIFIEKLKDRYKAIKNSNIDNVSKSDLLERLENLVCALENFWLLKELSETQADEIEFSELSSSDIVSKTYEAFEKKIDRNQTIEKLIASLDEKIKQLSPMLRRTADLDFHYLESIPRLLLRRYESLLTQLEKHGVVSMADVLNTRKPTIKDKPGFPKLKISARELEEETGKYFEFLQNKIERENFENIKKNIFMLLKNHELPSEINPVPKIEDYTILIKFTFYQLTLFAFGKLNNADLKNLWATFLKKQFLEQFKNVSLETITNKFTEKPTNLFYNKYLNKN